jgi:hypothetical protein
MISKKLHAYLAKEGLTAEPALEALEARLEAAELALEIAPLAEAPRDEAPEAAEEAAPESCRVLVEFFL